MSDAPREHLLDALRGFAVCGILLMNITVMGASLYAPLPPAPPTLADPQWQALLIQELFIEGRMRGLFTLLFGASVLLLIRNYEHAARPSPADLHYRRAFGLMALGLINAHVFLWYSDILFLYGWAALLLYPLRMLSWRWLLALGVALTLALVAFGALRQGIYLERLQNSDDTAGAAVTAQMLAAERAARLGGFLETLRFHFPAWEAFFAGRGFFVHLAEALSFMLVGMALLKLDILNGRRSARFYALLAAGGFGLGVGLSAVDMWAAWRASFAPDVFSPRAVTYQLSRLFGALGYVGLIGLFWRGAVRDRLGLAFQALGRMALTNYLGQSIVAALLFYGVGFKLFGRFTTYELWAIAAAILAAQAAFSVWWLRRFRLGPAEWVLRSISFWRVVALRAGARGRGAASEAVAP